MSDDAWPPKSPRAAMLSSPSGRSKYREAGLSRSPLRQPPATPRLLERLRAARANNDIVAEHANHGSDEEEDDEETLQLQLAAIEAKLKLKKLRKQQENQHKHSQQQHQIKDQVQVPLSPTKKTIPTPQPRSPGRILLGIDKGLKASDVSLARAAVSAPTSTAQSGTRNRRYCQAASRIAPTQQTPVSSFSERMSAVRADDRARQATRDASSRARQSAFSLDSTEMEGFRLAAEKDSSGRSSPVKRREQAAYSRHDVLRAKTLADSNRSLGGSGGVLANRRHSPSRPLSRSPTRPSSATRPPTLPAGDPALYEPFSGIDLASRILPHSFLKRTLPVDEYKVYTIPDLLRDVTSPAFELPDDIGNYVVFGIIAAKSSPRDHKQKVDDQSVSSADWERKWDDGSNNTRKFIVMTMTNLEWSLDLFLFGTAVPRYHRLTPGTVVAILNPAIMPPKRDKEDTGAFSLALNTGEDTVLEVGQARNLGFCSAKRKDGKDCGSWINAAKTEVCEFHLALQLHKTQSQRMGVNGGITGFGGMGNASRKGASAWDGRRKSKQDADGGRGWNSFTGEYYVCGGSATGVVKDPGSDVPYMANVRESRDKKALLKKRMDDQAREERVARQLGLLGHGNPGSQYLLHRTTVNSTTPSQPRAKGDDSSRKPSDTSATGSQRSALSTRDYILMRTNDPAHPKSVNFNGKRSAAAVSLSPIKKTRFVTKGGIKVAGRESLGATGTVGLRDNDHHHDDDDDDDDDELDII